MSERFSVVVARNLGLAVLLAVAFLPVLPRRGALAWDAFDAFTMGAAFALVGWGAEFAVLRVPGIDTPGGRLVRVAAWFPAGLWAYLLGREAWRMMGRDVLTLPALVWGGVFLVGLELLLHAGLAALRQPSIFSASPATSV